jgi:hypothetical protein
MITLKTIIGSTAILSTAFLLTSFSGEAISKSRSCQRMGLSDAECACKFALETGSRRAMQIFLRTYPSSDTACNAQNSTYRRPLVDESPHPQGNNNPEVHKTRNLEF